MKKEKAQEEEAPSPASAAGDGAREPEAGVDWTLIAAADRRGVVGIVDARGARLPWRLPEDLAYFKRVTMGHPLVMGRSTFESIGRALPGRLNVVLSRSGFAAPPGVVVVPDRAAAEVMVRSALDAASTGSRQAFVIGGAEVFAQFMPLARRIHLTELKAEFDGNRVFPDFAAGALRRAGWRELAREPHRSAEGWDYAFVVYERPQL